MANASHCLCYYLTMGRVSSCELHGPLFLSLRYTDRNYISEFTRMAVESADTPFATYEGWEGAADESEWNVHSRS